MGSTVTRQHTISTTAMGFAALFLTLTVVRYPDHAFEASLAGLRLWFDIVLPALLPFFVLSEVLMGLGVIRAMGVLLEPLMRPLFRIPGTGAFPLAMGLVSGYPLGAKIAGRLRRDNLCTREEGERLVAFANTADPLFMMGAVAVAMFGAASVGVTIAVSHYLAVLLVGFLLRYHAGGKMGEERPVQKGILSRAAREMTAARKQDNRPLGALFSDAVRDSMGSMIFIGGCIMMFSVFIRILSVSGVADTIAQWLSVPIALVGMDPALAGSMVSGLFEITLGAQMAADAPADLPQRLIAAGFIIGWSGLSVHAQVAAMVHGTDIRLAPYLLARLAHGVFAATLTWLLYPRITSVMGEAATAAVAGGTNGVPYLTRLAILGGGTVAILASLFALSLLVLALRRIRITGFRV